MIILILIKVAIVYFSRLGYTKKIAYEEANKLNAYIIPLKTKEKTDGTLGFWWCGRFGMHKWSMPIEDLDVNLKNYKNIIIVSPIWVFSICAPVREFCNKYKNDINNVSYIFTHFMNVSFKNVADEVDKILKNKRRQYISICVRIGNIKSYKIYK